MTAIRDGIEQGDVDVGRDCTVVWIDTREALVAHWHAGDVRLERMASDVAAHRKATGHVHYDPAVHHGGLAPRDAGGAQRLAHLARFVDEVATRIPPADDVVILGPGTVRERLERHILAADRHLSRRRVVTCHRAARLSERQLIARLRHVAGADQVRRTTGAYRWTDTTKRHASGSPMRSVQRVGPRPRIEPAIDDLIEEDLA